MHNLKMEHPNAFKFERQLVHRLYYDINPPKKFCLSQPKTAKLIVPYPALPEDEKKRLKNKFDIA